MFCARQGTGLETCRPGPGKRSMAAFLVSCVLVPTACYGSFTPNHEAEHSLPDEAATPDAHPEAVSDVTFDDGDGGEPADEFVEVALEDATGEDAAEDGEAGCVWSGEYVRAADGGCWLARDATMLEPVVEECCTYRLCSYACGPCVPLGECAPWCIRDTRWCLCSSPGPPVAETDRWTCNTYPQWNGTAFNVLVDAPAEPARSALDEIGARHCARVHFGPYAPIPGVDSISFSFIRDREYFAGPCPWQIAAEVGAVLPVRELQLESAYLEVLTGCAPCCESEPLVWDCYPVPR